MSLSSNAKIRTLVVDDEPLARQRIIGLLKSHPEIEMIGESRNGREAIETINRKQPDLIFLDIEMPDIDGFGVVSGMDLSYKPFIIFATAYNQYALKAFDIHAIDYLLKPYDDERFEEALELAKQQLLLRNTSKFNERLLQLVNEFSVEPDNYLKQFKIKFRGREKFIRTENILYIEAEGNYLMLHHEDGRDLFRSTMGSIEEELNPNRFIRVHRSFIINSVYIKNVAYLSNNEFKITLKNNVEVVSGRSYKDSIKAFISHSEI
ncbi:MAG: DNA-binding response regulator [Bacteroidetes bacterium]|nr:MAG: DNA-binding response regulator [Bacteroidota bacterium]